MADRAWGFCIYNDVALAVVRARTEGLRVLYVDLDVHHGDGVQALTYGDPGVLTLSLHESGRYLFPGTGFLDELGEGPARRDRPSTCRSSRTAARRPGWPPSGRSCRRWRPCSGPDVVVSQHGADSHAWDPLANLRVTTTAMAEAARLVDAVAHRWAGGRWLATGGGGYEAYRVVPRAWALTWLAGAHREPPERTPAAWRDRWAADAASFGVRGMPPSFLDEPNAGQAAGAPQRVGGGAVARDAGQGPCRGPAAAGARGRGPGLVGAGTRVGRAGAACRDAAGVVPDGGSRWRRPPTARSPPCAP